MLKIVLNLTHKERKVKKVINLNRKEVMKFSRFFIALGFFTLVLSACTHHSSCPAYSSEDSIDLQQESATVIDEKNV